ncbi:SsrA-binding protein [bacterium]|nr:SsrA-binding protein [bacterium]
MKSLARNKRATFDYEVLDTFEGGLMLLGTEVKSVKEGHMSLKGAFVTIHNEEPFLTNATIPPWQPKNAPDDYDPTRARKVLLKKSEIKTLIGAKQNQGLTIIPIRVYTKGSRVKIEIALARGKKKYDKKAAKRERDIQREVDRALRGKDD